MRTLTIVLLLWMGSRAAAQNFGAVSDRAFLASTTTDAEAGPVPQAPNICDCEKDYRCWNAVKMVFPNQFLGAENELDGAPQGRFLTDALPWVLKHPDRNGHFLRVDCGKPRKPCPEKRETLERRLLVVAFFRSIPRAGVLDDDYDAADWTIKPGGLDVLREARRCRPGFWKEIVGLVGASAR